MLLEDLKLLFFSGKTAKLAEAMDTSAQHVRNYTSAKTKVLELADGDFIIDNKHTKRIKIPDEKKGPDNSKT